MRFMNMKRLSLSFLFSTSCALIFSAVPVVRSAEAISPPECSRERPSCLLSDKMTTTLRLHKKGSPRETRLFISQTGFGGMFYASTGGLKRGAYTIKLGNTRGIHHYRTSRGGYRKFKFTRGDVSIVPNKFTVTEDDSTQNFTIVVNKVF